MRSQGRDHVAVADGREAGAGIGAREYVRHRQERTRLYSQWLETVVNLPFPGITRMSLNGRKQHRSSTGRENSLKSAVG